VSLTVAVALLTWAIAWGVSRITILYGRRRVVFMVLTGFVLGQLVRSLMLHDADPSAPIIGLIIPGLIALWIERQGVVETLSVLCICSVTVRLTLIVIGVEVVA
jgi:poly-gamma-glutamate biosynthesis protein PgsC/CapC